jgi:ketosteroid isomerase-like protein
MTFGQRGSLCRLATQTVASNSEKIPAAGRSATNHPKKPEETMKVRLLLALTGLAIGFAVPVLAFNFSGNVKALDEFNALGMKEDEASNENDAGALAALFTEDAVLVAPDGIFYGRQAIEKRYADVFQKWHNINHFTQADQLNAIGREPWSVGEWWNILQSQTGPRFVSGYWSAIYVRENDGWKMRMLTVSEHPQPARLAEK